MKRIIVSIVLGGIVASLIYARIVSHGGRPSLVSKVHAQEGCSVATLHGAYGFYRTGTTSAGPLAAVGNRHVRWHGGCWRSAPNHT